MNSQAIQVEEISVPSLQTTNVQFWIVIGIISVVAIIVWIITARIQRRRSNSTADADPQLSKES